MREITYGQAINEALHEEMARDNTVFLLGESVSKDFSGINQGLVERFGKERIRETIISEAFIIASSVGAALTGYRPIADIMIADFLLCAGDETLNYAAKWRFQNYGRGKVKLPMVIKAPIGGYSGVGPMHSQCPEGLLWHVPGLKIVLPSTPYDAKGLMKTAIRDNNPVVYFFHKQLMKTKGAVPEEEYTIPLGVADIKKEGSDVTVIATSFMVKMALDVANELQEKGVSVEVIDIRTLEPLDFNTIEASVRKTKRAIIVDEDVSRCGVTGEIGIQIVEKAFDVLKAPVQRVAAANLPIANTYLEKYCLPQPQDIADAIGIALRMKERIPVTVEAPGFGH